MIRILLALALVISLLPVSAQAAGATVYELADRFEEGGKYALSIRAETIRRGGTLFTFTKNGTVDGTYSIKGSSQYLVATRSVLSCDSSSVSAQASWTLTMTEDGAVTLRNNTSSQYYLLYGSNVFTINRTNADPLSLYDADGQKLVSVPEDPFQAYICNAEGTKYLSEAITADDAEVKIVDEYMISALFTMEEANIYGRRLQEKDLGRGSVWEYRNGALYRGSSGISEMLSLSENPDKVIYTDGKLQVGRNWFGILDGLPAPVDAAGAAPVRLWKLAAYPPAETGSYLAITCDIHYKFKADFAVDEQTGETIGTIDSADRMSAWLDQASEDFGGVYFDQLISCGDQGDANTKITSANYWERVRVAMDTARNHDKVLGGGFFINGNHEWANGQYSSLGTTNDVAKRIRLAGDTEERDDYIIYSLSAAQTNNSFNAADITALDEYLSTAPDDKPIFIASHYPLHNFNRTEQRRDDVVNTLNKYADSKQIIFLWGHNHTEEDPNYGVVFLEGSDNIPDDLPIKFTYCSAGCMTDDEYDVHAVFTKPKGMIAHIAPDRTVTLTYYDVNYQIMSTTVLPKPGAAEPKVDKTALAEAIEEFELIPPMNYTVESIQAHAAALARAKAVFADEGATQEEVDAAARALTEAYNDLTEPDWSVLEPALEAARKVDKSKYTEESAAALDSALETAEELISQGSVLQSDIDAAAQALHAAIAALVPKDEPPAVNKDDLKEIVEMAEQLDNSAYTEESVKAVEEAIENAKKVLSDEDATQEEVDAAFAAIGDAVRNRKEKAPDEPTPTPSHDCPGRIFTDMPAYGNWAHDPIDWAIVNNITAGATKTTFAPGAGCTRAQVVTFLWRAAGQPEPKSTATAFTDLKADGYYGKAVAWAVEKGITAGVTKDRFAPNNTCTRAQVVTFLYRVAK